MSLRMLNKPYIIITNYIVESHSNANIYKPNIYGINYWLTNSSFIEFDQNY